MRQSPSRRHDRGTQVGLGCRCGGFSVVRGGPGFWTYGAMADHIREDFRHPPLIAGMAQALPAGTGAEPRYIRAGRMTVLVLSGDLFANS